MKETGQKEQLNILIVHNYYQIPGGEDTVVANEKALLEEHGHKVLLYTRHNQELKKLGFLGKLLLPLYTLYSPRTYREVKSLIQREQIDVLHVHNTLNLISPSVYYAGFRSHIPVLQTMHNFRLLCPGAEFYRQGQICEDCLRCKGKSGLRKALKYRCYRGSRMQTLASILLLKLHRSLGTYGRLYYICLTQFNKGKLLELNRKLPKRKQIQEARVFVKPNFTIEKTSIESNICQKKDYYIYVGRLEIIKGIWTIVEAMATLPYELRILGTGTQQKQVEAYLKEKNLTNIKLLGFVDAEEKHRLIAGAKAMLVAPQWYETFGMTVIESFACHTPVLVGDLGNAADLVQEGVTGMHFSYQDAQDLRRVLQAFEALPPAKREEMGENAYRRYQENYSKESNYHQLLDIYRKCIEIENGGNDNGNRI